MSSQDLGLVLVLAGTPMGSQQTCAKPPAARSIEVACERFVSPYRLPTTTEVRALPDDLRAPTRSSGAPAATSPTTCPWELRATIVSDAPAASLAVFATDEGSVSLSVGESAHGYTLRRVQRSRATLRKASMTITCIHSGIE